LPSRAIAGEAIMAATTNPADKSFSVVIEHLLEKATPGTPRPARETCGCVYRIRSIDRTNIFVFARSRRGALTSDIDGSSGGDLRALVRRTLSVPRGREDCERIARFQMPKNC
jgi:hypothetical protein